MRTSALFVVLFAASLSARADAYIDPGTGSYILQMVIAGTLGAVFTAKTYWHRIKATLSRKR